MGQRDASRDTDGTVTGHAARRPTESLCGSRSPDAKKGRARLPGARPCRMTSPDLVRYVASGSNARSSMIAFVIAAYASA